MNLTTNYVAVMHFDVPVIGVCLGFEIIAAAYMGRIKKMDRYQQKLQDVKILRPGDPIFAGLVSEEIRLREQHSCMLSKLPPDFGVLGSSDVCEYEIIRHRNKPIYGFQSHPEVSGVNGLVIMRNFLNMCGFEVI